MAQSILNKAGITANFSKFQTDSLLSPGAVTFDNLIQNRAHAVLQRFLNRPNTSVFKRVVQAFKVPSLHKRLINPNRAGNARHINFIDKILRSWGLQRNGTIYHPSKALQRFFVRGNIENSKARQALYANLLQNSKALKYVRPQLASIKIDNRLNLNRVNIPVINQKAPQIPINLQDYIFGAKNLSAFRRDFNTGEPLFMSGLFDVAKRYQTGRSRGGGDTILAIPKTAIKNLFFTPHLATTDQSLRRQIMQGLKNGSIKLRDVIHNAGLDINSNPFYQTLINNKTDPGLLQKMLAVKELSPGVYIGKSLDWAHKYPYSKLQEAINKGILKRPL